MISVFHLPVRIVFGPKSVDQVGEQAARLGKKALIVTYPDIRKVGLLDRIIDNLKNNGIEAEVFEKVEPNPRSSTVDEGADLVRNGDIELLIGLGGGSAMDATKGIAMAASGVEPLWHYVETRARPSGPVLPIIQIPTLAGTGSEINPGAVITNWETHDKRAVFTPALNAKVALVDPELTLTVPRHQTASGGVDAFSHIVETYVTDQAPMPLTDGIRETVMKMIVDYLPKVLADLNDLEARVQISWASTVAMSQLARLGGGGGNMNCHGIEHAVSGYYDVTHGQGLAALLPAWMRYTEPALPERTKLLGEKVFGKSDGIAAMEEWFETVDMRLTLKDLGCVLEEADMIADLALMSSPGLAAHPRPLDKPVIAQIYQDSF